MEHFQNLQNIIVDMGFTIDNSNIICLVIAGLILFSCFVVTVLFPFWFYDLLDSFFRRPMLVKTTKGVFIVFGLPTKLSAKLYAKRYNKKHKDDLVRSIYSIGDISNLSLLVLAGEEHCLNFKVLYRGV